MEIGQHRLDCFEFEAFEFGTRINEEVGRCRTCDDGSCAEPNCVFESADRGGADGYDAT